jgi:hypothetical protein
MFGAVLANSLLGWFKGSTFITAPTTLYLSLHSGSPGLNGTANDVTTAIAGGRATLAVADLGEIADHPDGGRQTSSEELITFTNAALGAGVVTHIGIWSAASGGSFYGSGLLSQAASVQIGDIVRIPIGALRLRAVGDLP